MNTYVYIYIYISYTYANTHMLIDIRTYTHILISWEIVDQDYDPDLTERLSSHPANVIRGESCGVVCHQASCLLLDSKEAKSGRKGAVNSVDRIPWNFAEGSSKYKFGGERVCPGTQLQIVCFGSFTLGVK